MRSFAIDNRSLSGANDKSIAENALPLLAQIAFHANHSPHQNALIDQKTSLTYEELEQRSKTLAAFLWDAGAGPDRCVGLLLERSAGFVVAALAVLKTGAAYVPLDPSTPPQRVAFILSDAQACAVVTDSATVTSFSSAPCTVVNVDELDATPAVSFTSAAARGDDLAYVIYTSGSTGEPKGVEITHANLWNLVQWHQAEFGVTANDRASQVAGLGFDAAVWEVWPYLTAGASLHIADELTRRSPEALRDWIVANEISIGFVPTVLAERLIQMPWPPETALRILLTGGDTLHHRPSPMLPFTVVNNYGPTECTVVATSGIVSQDSDDNSAPSIGRPIANATALVLDDALRPVPNGSAGELCLAGAIVGRGYRNQPDLTASSFVTYLSTSGTSLRIYRTGDRVRLLENGELAFLGRVDDQVKVRGYRIELGEISSWLSRCPGVDSSTVTVGHDDGEACLIAYVVSTTSACLTESGVRDFLALHLPDYMIPQYVIPMKALPLTLNGKVDKNALPAPTPENRLAQKPDANERLASENFLQQQVSELIASLLDLPSVGLEDNFFMLGGHSMLGVQLVAQLRDRFGVKLTLRQLFTAPTPSALAAEIARLSEALT